MNHIFDCLNVRSRTEGIRTRYPDMIPYTKVDDPRIELFLYTIHHISVSRGKLCYRYVSYLSSTEFPFLKLSFSDPRIAWLLRAEGGFCAKKEGRGSQRQRKRRCSSHIKRTMGKGRLAWKQKCYIKEKNNKQ